MIKQFSIVIPAKDEGINLQSLLPKIRADYPNTPIIVVDDGSTDNTREVSKKYASRVISHPYSMGNGAAIKSGARECITDYVVFMDADGQHDPKYIQELLEAIESGYDMAVGARTSESQASILRGIGNKIYNFIASKVTGHQIADLTSGFRAVRREHFVKFLYMLPNGFSYPTTITMAFFRTGYSVTYLSIVANQRKGLSHLNVIKDGIRFFIIIIKIATLYSPLKVYTPISLFSIFLGLANYSYTYITDERFTNMSALLIIVGFIIFFMGLLAEQLTVLTYSASQRRNTDKR